MYLIRTFKTALLLWTLRKCALVWTATKRSIFAILVLITRFISGSSKCFPIRTAPIPIKNHIDFKFFSISCPHMNALVCIPRPGHSLEEKIKVLQVLTMYLHIWKVDTHQISSPEPQQPHPYNNHIWYLHMFCILGNLYEKDQLQH